MKKKANTKGKSRLAAASSLKTRRAKVKRAAKKVRGAVRKKAAGVKKKVGSKSKAPVNSKKIVRIMGQGQFTVDTKTLRRLNDLDNSIVELVNQERSDDAVFKEKLYQLTDMVVTSGKPLDPKAILQSDIILPSADLSIDEAKRLFKGEGVIPEI